MAAPLTRSRPITDKKVRGLFAKAFRTKTRKSLWPRFCEEIETFSKEEFFAALGTVPQLEAVDDDAEQYVKDMRDYSYDFTNQLFSTSLALKRSLLWYDQTGQTKTLMNSLAARVANFPDLRFIRRLRDGVSNACLTGANFFSTSHALGGDAPATQSNLLTGHTKTSDFDGVTTLAPALAELIQADVRLAMTQLAGWQDDNGQPFYQEMEPGDLTILCGPKIFTVMKLALGGRFINQTDNIFQGAVGRVACSNYLPITGAEAADWYLALENADYKPMVYSRYTMRPDSMMQDKLQGEALEDAKRLASVEIQTTLDNPNDSHVMLNKEHLIVANFLGEVAYGVPWTMIKVDNAAS
jgi:hypothetical protein